MLVLAMGSTDQMTSWKTEAFVLATTKLYPAGFRFQPEEIRFIETQSQPDSFLAANLCTQLILPSITGALLEKYEKLLE